MKGLLLVNLGTPDEPTPEAVGKYLSEFLMDPHVIGAPTWIRSILVNKIIVPRRSFQSAEKYQSIWTEKGSPLKVISQELKQKVQESLGKVPVELGFRYGNPSIDKALKSLQEKGVRNLMVLPLYPHHADSSVTTVWNELANHLPKYEFKITKHEIFYQADWFLNAWAEVITEELKKYSADHLLFSYHGIPMSHVLRAHPGCKSTAPRNLLRNCPQECNPNPCYLGQCRLTSKLISGRLSLKGIGYSTSFQSRLGPFQWTEPNTVQWLEKLYQKGIRRPLVVCPSFVSDCLETLEEIGITEREHFKKIGGEDLKLSACLNVHPRWVEGLAKILNEKLESL